MADGFLGEIRSFGFNFPPVAWAPCDGRLLSIAQNSALFAVIGTTYGGDGVQTFGLPDLRGRTPMHAGNGLVLGQQGGAESVTLLGAQLPLHTHDVYASGDIAASNSPAAALPGVKPRGGIDIYGTAASLVPLAPGAVGMATAFGGAHENRQPSLAVNFCICLAGVFPTRN